MTPLVAGFLLKEFLVCDPSRQLAVLRMACGGAHHSWDWAWPAAEGHESHDGQDAPATFVHVRQGQVWAVRTDGALQGTSNDTDAAGGLTPRVMLPAYHGREIASAVALRMRRCSKCRAPDTTCALKWRQNGLQRINGREGGGAGRETVISQPRGRAPDCHRRRGEPDPACAAYDQSTRSACARVALRVPVAH